MRGAFLPGPAKESFMTDFETPRASRLGVVITIIPGVVFALAGLGLVVDRGMLIARGGSW